MRATSRFIPEFQTYFRSHQPPLLAAWGRNDPWMPYLLIDHYADFLQPGMESERRLLESFAYAVKLAQPYQVPPTPGPYPRTVTISFRMGDL